MSFSKLLGEKYVGSVVKPIVEVPQRPELFKTLFVAILQLRNAAELYKDGFFNLSQIVSMPVENDKIEQLRLKLLSNYSNPYGRLRGYLVKLMLREEDNMFDDELMNVAVAKVINKEENEVYIMLQTGKLTKNGKSYFAGGKLISPIIQGNELNFEDSDLMAFIAVEDYPRIIKELRKAYVEGARELECILCANNISKTKEDNKSIINVVDVIPYSKLSGD